MRRLQWTLAFLIFVTFAGAFGAASRAATLGDWVVPGMIGLCFAASLSLLLSDRPKRGDCKERRDR